MRVVAPLAHGSETAALCDAGADELYCGVLSRDWRQAYTSMQSPNRRDVLRASLHSFEELEQVVRTARAAGVKVCYTANVVYGPPQYPMALADVAAALEAGVEAVIVADLGFALALRRAQRGRDFQLYASTVASIYSAAAARPWARIGARCVILPRDLTLLEVQQLSRALDDELGLQAEVLVHNVLCKFSDGFCAHDHGAAEWDPEQQGPRSRDRPIEAPGAILRPSLLNAVANRTGAAGLGQACMLSHRVRVLASPPADPEGQRTAHAFAEQARFWRHLDGCGGCLLHALEAAGVAAVKIVGRVHPLSRKQADLRFLRGVLQLPPRQRLPDRIRQLHHDIYGYDCSGFCYYQ